MNFCHLLVFLLLINYCPQNVSSDLLRMALGARNALGVLRHGLRRTACDVLRNGQIYHQPCEQYQGPDYRPPKSHVIEKEVVIEEAPYDNSHERPSYPPRDRGAEYDSYHQSSDHHQQHQQTPYRQKEPEKIVVKEVYSSPKPPIEKIIHENSYDTRGRSSSYQAKPYEKKPSPRIETESLDDTPPEESPETFVDEPKPVKPKPQPKGKVQEDPCQFSDGILGVCMPAAYCYAQYDGIEEYRSNICEFEKDSRFVQYEKGICCPKQDVVLDVFDLQIRVPHQALPSRKIRHISLEEINTAAKQAQEIVDNAYSKERQLISKGMYQRYGSSQMMHQAFFGEFDPEQFQLTKGGFITTITTLIIKRTFKLSVEDARDGLYKYSIENTDLERFCIKEPTCHQSKYRTIDGSCNNHRRPLWAKSNTAFERLVPPQYSDGLHQPRTRTIVDDKTLLPSSRLVSSYCAGHHNKPDPKHTLILMQWGQFLDHDLTLASSTRASTGQGLMCCDKQKPVDHHACFPIKLPDNDPFYKNFNQQCMHFVRNSPAPRSDCSLGHREQMNTLTHVIDASMVYGASPEKAKSLRTFHNGLMRTSFVNGQPFLPVEKGNSSEDCAIDQLEQQRFKCFVAGDGRVNEQSGLTMLHNLFLREHNRIAEELKLLNKRWNDESLYQEARRIVAAEIQHITYNEWLPIILGRRVMKLFNILPKPFGFSKDYNSRVNPNILNEFATAAFRMHTLVQGTIILMNENGVETKRLRLSDLFNNPKTLWEPNRFDQYLNGYTTEPAQSMDGQFTEELTNHLFRPSGTPFGMDLIALNIQRGRDHGLPGYNTYRHACGLRSAKKFEDLKADLFDGSWKLFSDIYQHVDDIDLFIGASHEVPLDDSLVGPTFACILGEQFRRTKVGDRFWYENGGLPISFKPQQLAEIRKVSLASLICDNSDSIQTIQPLAFLRPGGWNKRISCNKIARMNLNHWKNEKIWT